MAMGFDARKVVPIGKSVGELSLRRKAVLRMEESCRFHAAKKNLSGESKGTVPQTDTGRRGEYPKALVRTVGKELGNITP